MLIDAAILIFLVAKPIFICFTLVALGNREFREAIGNMSGRDSLDPMRLLTDAETQWKNPNQLGQDGWVS